MELTETEQTQEWGILSRNMRCQQAQKQGVGEKGGIQRARSPRLLRRANRIDKQNRKGEGQKSTAQESWVKGLEVKIRGRLNVGHCLTPIGLQVEAAKVL